MTTPSLETFLALLINSEETFQGGIVGMSELLSIPNTNETQGDKCTSLRGQSHRSNAVRVAKTGQMCHHIEYARRSILSPTLPAA
jgi:hypothetical protein